MARSPAPVETWERRHGAALAPLVPYRRREPEKTLLHAVVRDRLEPFLAAARDRSPSGRGLPAHVERDLRAYLDCGLLCRGFARLCRYAVRPPFALHRPSQGPDGRLVYRMKRPRGGSLFLVLTPDELLAHIATLVPPPRTHALRYHALFAPHSKHRARVVPRREPSGAAATHEHGERPTPPTPHSATPPSARRSPESAGAFQLTTPEPPPGRPAPRYRIPWAEPLQRVFAVDVLECPRCAGRLELIAFISEPTVARKILDHLGLASQAPPLGRASEPGEDLACDPGPDYAAADPAPED